MQQFAKNSGVKRPRECYNRLYNQWLRNASDWELRATAQARAWVSSPPISPDETVNRLRVALRLEERSA